MRGWRKDGGGAEKNQEWVDVPVLAEVSIKGYPLSWANFSAVSALTCRLSRSVLLPTMNTTTSLLAYLDAHAKPQDRRKRSRCVMATLHK